MDIRLALQRKNNPPLEPDLLDWAIFMLLTFICCDKIYRLEFSHPPLLDGYTIT